MSRGQLKSTRNLLFNRDFILNGHDNLIIGTRNVVFGIPTELFMFFSPKKLLKYFQKLVKEQNKFQLKPQIRGQTIISPQISSF